MCDCAATWSSQGMVGMGNVWEKKQSQGWDVELLMGGVGQGGWGGPGGVGAILGFRVL